MYNATIFTKPCREIKTLANKNNVSLCAIIKADTQEVTHYEIYMENEFLTKYADEKAARKIWKDFAA